MIKTLKYNCWKFLLILLFCVLWLASFPQMSQVQAAYNSPTFSDFRSALVWSKSVVDPRGVSEDKTLIDNIKELFYPGGGESWNRIYHTVRDLTLWIMIIFLVWTGAALLFNRKSEDMMKALWSLVYIVLWWCFIYWASWLFWDVLNFRWFSFDGGGTWIWWAVEAITGSKKVFFQVLAALKWFAFFLAIIMIVVTWIRVIMAAEKDKWKKLVKWIINVVVALLVIKWIDFIYYMAADSGNFIAEASTFIINIAKLFGYLYWVVIVIMVFVAWYLYITDWWSGNWFKKACNILVNIVLSALVLFSFLLILYQIFAEFGVWEDIVVTPIE